MKRLLLLPLLAAAAAAACSQPQFRSHDVPPPLQLTEDSSGERFDLAVGQEADVTLRANPTTGYRWQLAGAPSAVVAQLGEPRFQPPPRPIPGAGGLEVWRVKAMTTGDAELTWEYRRPWEKGGPAARSVTITFLVR